jgi:hypothetical protein
VNFLGFFQKRPNEEPSKNLGTHNSWICRETGKVPCAEINFGGCPDM